MWNAALRRVVRDEEEREREKRAAAQLRLRREAQRQQQQEAAAGANTTTTVSVVTTTTSSSTTTETTSVNHNNIVDNEEENGDEEEEDEGEDDDDHVQRHLLSRPHSSWSCLEDSQQAFCLAMNRQRSVFAVGERDGRVSIWDNVAMRVITRELDPTLVAVPETHPSVESSSGDGVEVETREGVGGGTTERRTTTEREATSSGDDATLEDDGDGDEEEAVTNDDGSVEAEDNEENNEEEDENEEERDDEDNDREADGNTEEEEEEDNDRDDDRDDDRDHDRDDSKKTVATTPERTVSAVESVEALDDTAQEPTVAPQSTVATGSPADDGDSHVRAGLSVEELRVVKTLLKVVTCCAWSCDTRWLFAGCEEKSNRRGRLCVWDVAAATIFATFRYVSRPLTDRHSLSFLHTVFVASQQLRRCDQLRERAPG